MADTPTTFWNLIKPEVGSSLDSWGGKWNANLDVIDALLNRLCPVGSVLPYGAPIAPPGWHMCQGQQIATATFPRLFQAIGYTYGGSGALFAVPNLQGRVPLMAGAGTDQAGVPFGFAMASAGGFIQWAMQQANLPNVNLATDVTGAHQHPGYAEPIGHGHVTDFSGDHGHPINSSAGTPGGLAIQLIQAGTPDAPFFTGGAGNHQHNIPLSGEHSHVVDIGFGGGHGHTVNTGGVSQPIPLYQPFQVLNFIIWGGNAT